LSYINTQKNKYAYKLEGFNTDWLITDGSSRKVTYTNLDPGKYTFRVKASNDDGVWNDQGIAVKVIILTTILGNTAGLYNLCACYYSYIILSQEEWLFRRQKCALH
jgi:hypothetical protein